MAYDEGLAELMRNDLIDVAGISEKHMFGGVCFMLNGHMMCGVHKNGGMFRIGKELEAKALELDGIDPLSFTGRKMGGMVDITEDAIADDDTRAKMMALAQEFVGSLPPK